MAPPEANIEMVAMVRNLPNDCIDSSLQGASARDETTRMILLVKHQRAKIVEVQRQGPANSLKLKTDNLAANARTTASTEVVALMQFQTQWSSPGGGGGLSIDSNKVTSLAPGETS
jgi:hypothetical protein